VDDFADIPVGIHVRLGDFSGNMLHPVSWYVDALRAVRRRDGRRRVFVFSDGSEAQLAALLAEPEVELVRGTNAIVDLLLLARSQLLIGSGSSTFSSWAAFLGQMPVVARRENPMSWWGLEAPPGGHWTLEAPGRDYTLTPAPSVGTAFEATRGDRLRTGPRGPVP
jgi:hypothetical protein